jgi:hypothetical protein
LRLDTIGIQDSTADRRYFATYNVVTVQLTVIMCATGERQCACTIPLRFDTLCCRRVCLTASANPATCLRQRTHFSCSKPLLASNAKDRPVLLSATMAFAEEDGASYYLSDVDDVAFDSFLQEALLESRAGAPPSPAFESDVVLTSGAGEFGGLDELPVAAGEDSHLVERPLGDSVEFGGQAQRYFHHPFTHRFDDVTGSNTADYPMAADLPAGAVSASDQQPSELGLAPNPAPDAVARHDLECPHHHSGVIRSCIGENAANSHVDNLWYDWDASTGFVGGRIHERNSGANEPPRANFEPAIQDTGIEFAGHKQDCHHPKAQPVKGANASDTADRDDRAAHVASADRPPSDVGLAAVVRPAREVVVVLQGIQRPHDHDVKCGRGNPAKDHPGNHWYRRRVHERKAEYDSARSKQEKRRIAKEIVDLVRNRRPPGRFLERDPRTGLWNEIGDGKAIAKAGQALRDAPTAQGGQEGGGAVEERPPPQPARVSFSPVSKCTLAPLSQI